MLPAIPNGDMRRGIGPTSRNWYANANLTPRSRISPACSSAMGARKRWKESINYGRICMADCTMKQDHSSDPFFNLPEFQVEPVEPDRIAPISYEQAVA